MSDSTRRRFQLPAQFAPSTSRTTLSAVAEQSKAIAHALSPTSTHRTPKFREIVFHVRKPAVVSRLEKRPPPSKSFLGSYCVPGTAIGMGRPWWGNQTQDTAVLANVGDGSQSRFCFSSWQDLLLFLFYFIFKRGENLDSVLFGL